MHCTSCEVLIERRLKKLEHVQAVQVNATTGKVQLLCSHMPQFQAVQNAVKADGYTVLPWKNQHGSQREDVQKNTVRDYKEIGVIFLLLLLLYQIFTHFQVLP
jgi:cation transport ATPase